MSNESESDPLSANYQPEDDLTKVATVATNDEIILPDSIDGRDRFISIEKITAETISPLIKRDVSVDSVIEVVDRNFSYPLTAHVGLKFDSRSFPNIPKREFDVKMKKVKVPSNYFPTGGNGLDRRYVYANPNYAADPNNLDLAFVVDQNMNYAARALLRRNLKSMISKIVSGYTYVRATVWETKATSSGKNTVYDYRNNLSVNDFYYYETDEFFELETPDSAGGNQTNLYKKLYDLLDSANIVSSNPDETTIANFFIRKNDLGLTPSAGSLSEATVVKKIWSNTVRKVIYFSGSTPEEMTIDTYNYMLGHARENAIQFYYLNTDPDLSGTRTLRELAVESGGGKFNLLHKSDIELQKYFDSNFYDSNKIYYGDWDGTFKIAWTDNPAWILYDIVTDFTYGLGNHLDSSSLDKWTLYDIGRYCDAVDDDGRFNGVPDGKGGLEPRYTCNIIFYNKDEAYKVLKDIAAIFKGMLYWNTEGFSFFADKPKDAIMYFANANVKDGVFNYSETAKNLRYTSVEVTYNDRYDSYKTKIEFIEDVDAIRNFGLNPFKVNAAGCTSRSEARRIGRYVMCGSAFETDTVTFSAGLEAAYLQPGDIFGVSDEVKNVARTFGRILDVNESTAAVKIDGEFSTGLASGLYIHVPSGGYSVSDLNSLTGSDGGFTGTLENIRSRRQAQTRWFNISSFVDDTYGATLNLTGDFWLKSGITDVYVNEGRISGAGQVTGQTVLTGINYIFPNHTVVAGNPKFDTLTFSGVSGVLSDLEIDIDISGTAGTGQVVSAPASNWTGTLFCNFTAGQSIFYKNSSSISASAATNEIKMINIAADGTLYDYGAVSSLNDFWTNSIMTNAAADSLVMIYTNGTAGVSNSSFSPSSTWDTYGATEIYKIGKDVSASSSAFGYCAIFVKGGYRILERASKALNDYGSIKFEYKDILAFSKLRPYYTFQQADVGNAQKTAYEEWKSGRAYKVGNIVKYNSQVYICTADHDRSVTFLSSPTPQDSDDYIAGNATRSKWALGNNYGYSTIGFPKNFYGSSKVYLGTTLTSTHVSNAFKALGVEVYVGAGTLGQTDLRVLDSVNGIGYTGLVYGTGYERGFYGLTVDTTPQDLAAINEGSLYVLSGSGVEPKLYKAIGIKEEEANSYSVVGLEYMQNKENFVERDMIDTSPSVYVKSPYDKVIKPDAPTTISDVGGSYYTAGGITIDGVLQPTGLNFSWDAVTSTEIFGYKVYLSRPDYSSNAVGAITEHYFVPSGTTSLTVPLNQIWGQYDISVYGQGTLYKFLSDEYASKTLVLLPNPSASGAGHRLSGSIVTGMYVETADTDSLKYGIAYSSSTFSGTGAGNFTSRDLTFRWEYLDPTGGIVDSVEAMRHNPFFQAVPEVTVSVTDFAGQILNQEKNYEGFSYKIDIGDNIKFVNKEDSNWEDVNDSRNLALRVEVKDHLGVTFTGNYFASNIPPSYSEIEVVDCFQNSPYYILSGYYGHSTFTGIAVWGPDVTTTVSGISVISGSGIRYEGTGRLLRSEDSTREVLFKDISGAFLTATGYNGTGLSSTPARKGVGINYKGVGTDPDYEAYVNSYGDLADYYKKIVSVNEPSKTKEVWGSGHYSQFGSAEGRTVPNTKGNPLGISDLSSITTANLTGFSGLSFTVLPERFAEGQIIFNCYSTNSNKDVLSIDIYTGLVSEGILSDDIDVLSKYNFLKNTYLADTRSYSNTFFVDANDGLQYDNWYYFRIVPWDDFGPGPLSTLISGYLSEPPRERSPIPSKLITLNGGMNENNEIQASSTSLKKNYKYKITTLGSSVNWTAIGATDAAVNVEFIYNGTAITGSGGKVKRVVVPYLLSENDMNVTLIRFNTQSESVVILPTKINEGMVFTLVNQGVHKIHIRYAGNINVSDGEEIAILRPQERMDVEKIENGWIDPRGDTLSL